MKKLTILAIAIGLCILSAPVMAHDNGGEPSEGKSLYGGDNIWIAISPMESHPMYIDRPNAVIPTISGYPIRVAVYSNPYVSSTLDENNGAVTVVEHDTNAMDFDVTSLTDYPKKSITLRIPNSENPAIPSTIGAVYAKVHTESKFKWQYVFYVRDMEELNANINRLFFCVTDETGEIIYRGSGSIMVTGGSGSSSDATKGNGRGGSGGGSGSGSGSGSGQHDSGDGGSGGSGKHRL